MEAKLWVAHPLYTELPVSIEGNAMLEALACPKAVEVLQKCKEYFEFVIGSALYVTHS
jgi:hypothetical protein